MTCHENPQRIPWVNSLCLSPSLTSEAERLFPCAQVESTGAVQTGEGGEESEPTTGPLSWQVSLAITLQPPLVSGADQAAAAGSSERVLEALSEPGGSACAVAYPPIEMAASAAIRAQAEEQCMSAWDGDASLLQRGLQ